MEIRITKTSNWDFEEIREVKSLDCLFELAKEFSCNQFVVEVPSFFNSDADVEIYDTWRE